VKYVRSRRCTCHGHIIFRYGNVSTYAKQPPFVRCKSEAAAEQVHSKVAAQGTACNPASSDSRIASGKGCSPGVNTATTRIWSSGSASGGPVIVPSLQT